MQRFPKAILILSLTLLSAAVSLSLIVASLVMVNHLRDHHALTLSW